MAYFFIISSGCNAGLLIIHLCTIPEADLEEHCKAKKFNIGDILSPSFLSFCSSSVSHVTDTGRPHHRSLRLVCVTIGRPAATMTNRAIVIIGSFYRSLSLFHLISMKYQIICYCAIRGEFQENLNRSTTMVISLYIYYTANPEYLS